MSFYINNTNPFRPGPIGGNPVNGLCEKVLIETTKVFDACVSQTTETGVVLPLTDFNPENPTLPLTYISTENQQGISPTVSNVVIERLDNTPNYANVSLTITLPVTVTYRDADGILGTASSTITIQKYAILFVPQPSVAQIVVKAQAIFSSRIGTYSDENTFTVTGCLRVILKVTADVDILVPSYGYPVLPPCQACQDSNGACPGLNDLPIYPTATN